ncbi:MAG: hypothetical protein ABI589_13160 [Burkholderiales bacterium]
MAAEPASSCSSDGQIAPTALLERFINADCADCWSDEPPAPAAGAVALDWIAPGPQGDDGALSAAARRGALQRLQAIGRPLPDRMLDLGSTLRPVPTGSLPAAPIGDASARPASEGRSAPELPSQTNRSAPELRVAHGLPVGNYIGTSIELKGAAPGRWRVWLVLVETLPPGLEGSPVERNLVRNSLQFEWVVPAHADPKQTFKELRPMQIPAGAQPERLNLVGWIEDANGPAATVGAIARSRCLP